MTDRLSLSFFKLKISTPSVMFCDQLPVIGRGLAVRLPLQESLGAGEGGGLSLRVSFRLLDDHRRGLCGGYNYDSTSIRFDGRSTEVVKVVVVRFLMVIGERVLNLYSFTASVCLFL